MPLILKIEIEVGNDAMKRPNELADALQQVSRRVRGANMKDGEGAKIMDANGNSVGRWGYHLDDPGSDAG